MDEYFNMTSHSPFDQSFQSQENLSSRSDLSVPDSFSEGYLSPASAIAQGWSPHVIYVPSPMIPLIPSPMTSTMIQTPLIEQINPEAIERFTQGNSGLGLVNPLNGNTTQPEIIQSSFEDMLISLGLLPTNNNIQSHQSTLQKWTKLKDKDRTLYKCPWEGCQKTFTRPYNLKSHYRGHTGERPFICETCLVGFARKHDLKRHVKIHEGLKSFSCPFCQKSFTRSDALKRHLKNDRSVKESSCASRQRSKEEVDQSL